jgi:hypothetical protein
MSTTLIPYPALVKDEPKRFADAFTALAASKNTPADELKIRAYAKVLSDSPIAGTEQAAQRLMATPSPYLPPAGEWRSLADTIGLEAYGAALAAAQPTPPTEEGDEARLRAAQRGFLAQLRQHLSPDTVAGIERRLSTTHVPTVYCETCNDSGFVSVRDPRDHQRVGYIAHRVKTCHCYRLNPVLERQRVNQRQAKSV